MPAMLGYFGISNNGVNLAINLLALFLAIVWLALIYWTPRAKRPSRPRARRLRDGAARCSRSSHDRLHDRAPAEYLEDVRERELEMAGRGARLAEVSYLAASSAATRSRRTS